MLCKHVQKGAFRERERENSVILQRSKHIRDAVAKQFSVLVAWLRCHFSHMRIWTESTGTFVTWTGALKRASYTIVVNTHVHASASHSKSSVYHSPTCVSDCEVKLSYLSYQRSPLMTVKRSHLLKQTSCTFQASLENMNNPIGIDFFLFEYFCHFFTQDKA